MKLIAVQDTLWEKGLLFCVIPDKNAVVHPNIYSQIHIFTVFWSI